jgi:phytanoyl-CoA hydroxylase
VDCQKIKNEFYENGWCKIPSFFNQDIIEEIKKELRDFIEVNVDNYDVGEIHFTEDERSQKKINTIHVLSYKSKYFKSLLFNEKVIKLMEYILDDEVEPQWSQLFAKPAKVGMASPMHQDNYFWNIESNKTVTLWIAIDKVIIENAGLSYYNKSHNLGLVKHEASFAKGTSQRVSDVVLDELPISSLMTPLLQPGDILLHHGCMIHGSQDNKSDRDRRGMSMWYKAKSAGVDKIGLKNYENSLKKQLNNIYKEE